ncbi:fibronectin type III domain-containing protein, partial [Nonlabens mediterrranea]|nr:fibronectin type III domain-containing protein [Nonlabens mediterrranea]
MKIKLLILLLIFATGFSSGQVVVQEDFNASTSLPTGWTSNGSGTSTQSCDGNSFRRNVYNTGGNSTMTLTTPNQVASSNGNDISVSVDYKVVDWSLATSPTPANFGTLELQFSIDDGSNWTTFSTIDSSNHIVSNTCALISGTIPAANVPIGSDVKIRTLNTYNSGDYYMYNDNFTAVQLGACLSPMALDAVNITSLSADLSWTSGGSGEASWEIEYGIDGFTQGTGTTVTANSNPYTINTLTESTDYDYYVRANCGAGDVSAWAGPFSFSTPASCLVPTVLDAANITSSSADLSWTSGGSGEASWEIEYGIDGFTQGAGTTISPATNPVNTTGLMSNTDYDYYVRANCGASDYSEWVGPFSFTTLCAAEIPDYLEDF